MVIPIPYPPFNDRIGIRIQIRIWIRIVNGCQNWISNLPEKDMDTEWVIHEYGYKYGYETNNYRIIKSYKLYDTNTN